MIRELIIGGRFRICQLLSITDGDCISVIVGDGRDGHAQSFSQPSLFMKTDNKLTLRMVSC